MKRATKYKKVKKIYVEENIYFGRSVTGENIMIYAFEPLKLLAANGAFSLVKKRGRGQRRKYAIRNELLKWEA